MFLVRPCQEDDIPKLHELLSTRTTGMTSIPNSIKEWRSLVRKSSKSFKSIAPKEGVYIFVLIDLLQDKLIGLAALYNKPHMNLESYRSTIDKRSLRLIKEHSYSSASEFGSFFIDPTYRGKGLGQLLNFTRVKYLLLNVQKFQDTLVAELRGHYVGDTCPFWTELGQKFLGISFLEVDQHIKKFGPQGLVKALPKEYRISNEKDVANYIGTPHKDSKRAYHFLLRLGFKFSGFSDPIDGGPTLEASLNDLSDPWKKALPCKDPTASKSGILLYKSENDFQVLGSPIGIDPTFWGHKLFGDMSQTERYSFIRNFRTNNTLPYSNIEVEA